MAEARTHSRILSSLRHNIGTPEYYANYINSNFPDLKITMIKGDDLTKHKLNGIHAVGRGAIAERQP